MMNRVSELRLLALEPHKREDEFFYKFFKKFSQNENESKYKRYGEASYYAFANMTPVISDGELIVGKCDNVFTDVQLDEWNNTYLNIAQQQSDIAGKGQDSHMAIDYELVLNEGISGIIKKIDGYLGNCDPSKVEFYNAAKKCLEGVIQYSDNYSEYALELSEKTNDENRKKELIKISKVCKNVPKNPAKTFYEAIQSVHFISHCITMDPLRFVPQQFQLGHPDRYLLPYYEKDIREGNITKEYAQLLLDCLGIMINIRVPNGLSSGYLVGGRDGNGSIVSNELTDMCMQVVDDIRLVYPAVGLCYADGTPDSHLEKACKILSHGCSHPAIFGDDTIAKGLKYYGLTDEESHNYIHSTCVEITPVGASNVWVASPYTNMPQILIDCMDKEYDSFDDLLYGIFEKLDVSIKENFEHQERMRKVRYENGMNPLLSCFVNDCLKNGTDIEKGGAKYNWIMPSFVGVANLVDSLFVLKQVVFDKKEYTISAVKKMMDADFEGFEHIRMSFLNNIPKYGNDIDEIDKYVEIIINHIVDECKKYKGFYNNANLIPSVFCWQMHEFFGKDTIATPDGRKSGFPLGDGSGPCQGREMNGPTSSILSSTKWKHYPLIGGVAVNMKFSKKSLGAQSVNAMTSLVKTYIMRGGFEIQINVVDKDVLQKAVQSPEQYRDLVVRIGGYSDYFVTLSEGMQQEVILRSEHQI